MTDEKRKNTNENDPKLSGGVAIDKELEAYRDLVQVPDTFRNGFTWVSVVGAIFCGLLMFPGAIYLGLLAGVGLNQAATWVTVIVFSEITRRAMKAMSKEEMVILLSVAGAMIGGSAMIPGGPFGQMIWRQYLITSDAVRDAGLYGQFPSWFAPSPGSEAITHRTFLHIDWAVPILLLLFMTVIGFIKTWTLGYALFRLTSDVEKLPFPMAPIGATGVMALADGEAGEKTWRWTAFSIGTVLGLGFGVLSVGIPAVSSAFLAKPIIVLPIPWFELSTVTEGIFPATPTGIIFDVGLILMGFVVPFWAVMGAAAVVVLKFILNPILYDYGVLTSWKPGMDTINTMLSNNIDFYFSLNIGFMLGIAAVSLYQTIKQVKISLAKMREEKEKRKAGEKAISMWDTPEGRGDYSLKFCFIGYIIAAGSMVAVSKMLVPAFPLFFLILFAFIYTPLQSYLDARIMGMAGQHVTIPFVREGFILLSGAKGVDVWLAPIPVENYGYMAQNLRTIELTGVNFRSNIKAWCLTTPLIFILSFVFWSFLWNDSPIPSDLYPYAQKMWDLNAKNTMIMWSATTGEEGAVTLFDRSFHPEYIGCGFFASVLTFVVGGLFGLPTMFLFGFARGIGQIPHGLIVELIGAFLARFYFHRKFGKQPFLKTAPILLAGYMVGIGLIGMGGVAIRLITSAISSSPF